MDKPKSGLWGGAQAYEQYMGRWSRQVSREFVDWLSVSPHQAWLDVGCGTGVLSLAILAAKAPSRLVGIDSSEAFLEAARAHIDDQRVQFLPGKAEMIPQDSDVFAAAVSGLVLNFVADKRQAVAEMVRVVAPGGTVAHYVWDYAGHMQIMRYFFDVATALDAQAAEFDDGLKAPICRPAPLQQLFTDVGLVDVAVRAIDIPAAFANFDEYWLPFLGGTGSAPKYCASLSPEARQRLRDELRARLPTGPEGEILLAVRAWAIKGTVPERL